MPEGEQINQEIADLERQLREKREQLSSQQVAGEIAELPHEKETLHEMVGERIAESSIPSGVPSGQTPPLTPPPVIATPSPQLTEEMKVEVQGLVNMAFTQGVSQAIKKVRATNNAALIDAFHDMLVDELYNYLVERGKLKQF